MLSTAATNAWSYARTALYLADSFVTKVAPGIILDQLPYLDALLSKIPPHFITEKLFYVRDDSALKDWGKEVGKVDLVPRQLRKAARLPVWGLARTERILAARNAYFLSQKNGLPDSAIDKIFNAFSTETSKTAKETFRALIKRIVEKKTPKSWDERFYQTPNQTSLSAYLPVINWGVRGLAALSFSNLTQYSSLNYLLAFTCLAGQPKHLLTRSTYPHSPYSPYISWGIRGIATLYFSNSIANSWLSYPLAISCLVGWSWTIQPGAQKEFASLKGPPESEIKLTDTERKEIMAEAKKLFQITEEPDVLHQSLIDDPFVSSQIVRLEKEFHRLTSEQKKYEERTRSWFRYRCELDLYAIEIYKLREQTEEMGKRKDQYRGNFAEWNNYFPEDATSLKMQSYSRSPASGKSPLAALNK